MNSANKNYNNWKLPNKIKQIHNIKSKHLIISNAILIALDFDGCFVLLRIHYDEKRPFGCHPAQQPFKLGPIKKSILLHELVSTIFFINVINT